MRNKPTGDSMKEKTIAKELGVTDFPFSITDKKGNIIYEEFEDGFWIKFQYNKKTSGVNYWENSDGYWEKREYDSKGCVIRYEDSSGYWINYQYDENCEEIYRFNSKGEEFVCGVQVEDNFDDFIMECYINIPYELAKAMKF